MTDEPSHQPEFAAKIVEKYVSSQSNVFLVYGNTKDVYQLPSGSYVPLVDFLVEALIKPDRPTAPRIVIVYDPATGISFRNPLDRQLVAREIGEDRLDKILSASRRDIVTACATLRSP